jgi:hypothetical protein
VHELLKSNKACLFSDFCAPLVPRKYLLKVRLVDETGCQKEPACDFVELIRTLTTGCKLLPPTDLAEWLGFSSPGALLLPVSVRVPHSVYQTVGFIAYAKQLVHFTYEPIKGRLPAAKSSTTPLLEEGVVVGKLESSSEDDSSSDSGSCLSLTELPIPQLPTDNRLSATHIGLVDIGMPNTLCTLPLVVRGLCVQRDINACLGDCADPPQSATLASNEHDDAIATFAREEGTPEEGIHLVNSPLRVGTYILEFNNRNARSSARSSGTLIWMLTRFGLTRQFQRRLTLSL